MYNGSFLLGSGETEVVHGITVDGSEEFDVRVVAIVEEVNGERASSRGKKVWIKGKGFGEHPGMVEVAVEGNEC